MAEVMSRKDKFNRVAFEVYSLKSVEFESDMLLMELLNIGETALFDIAEFELMHSICAAEVVS